MRAYAVLGPWRGGTSLVTGLLRELGVFVGDEFVDAETNYCTFEDTRLQLACLQAFDERPGGWKYYGTTETRVHALRDWLIWAIDRAEESGYAGVGGKHPIMCKLVEEIFQAWNSPIADLTVISVVRSPEDVHHSWTRSLGPQCGHWWPRWDRVYVVDDLIRCRDESLRGRPHIQVDFDSLRREPDATIRQLADICDLREDLVPGAVATVRDRT